MAIKINPEEAASWSKEELKRNLHYLKMRENHHMIRLIAAQLKGDKAEAVQAMAEGEEDLESMTKDDLLQLAEQRDVDVSKSSSKAEIIEALRA